MKVLNPNNTSHSIKLIPREYPTLNISLVITKEGYNTTQTVVSTYSISNGLMTLNFDLEGVAQDRFSYKLTEGETVISRDKLFFTEQEPQEFKLTKNTFTYVG